MDFPLLQDTLPEVSADPGGSPVSRILVIIGIALTAHMTVRLVRAGADRLLRPTSSGAVRGHPKVATVVSLLSSAIVFTLWFIAVGLALSELNVNLTAYFATATVIGLAVGFGSQGLVQDLVIGLTLIFTDAMNVGDMVEVSGQVGRIQRMGLRFTTLTNFLGQTVYIPNRNIAVVGRYRRNVVRAFIDVQVPDGADADDLAPQLHRLARGFRAQHPAAILSEPELVGVQDVQEGGWRFVRLKLRIWPGQQALIETAFRQRVVAWMKTRDESYADWMVTVTLRA